MKIVCLTVGKKHNPELVAAIEHYEKRLKPYVDFSFDYVQPSDKETESEKLLLRIKSDDFVILLDERGTQLNNLQLAHEFERAQNHSVKRCIIIIGGAYGVNADVFKRSNYTMSISKLVFPHQLVRLLVVEQLYRSFNYNAGGNYHHE